MDGQPLPGSFDLEVLPGRPLLYWAGKQSLRTVEYCEARLKERYGVPGEDGWVNRLYWGDNLQVMCHLLREFRGKIKLIYIDPPFDSKAEYRKKIRLKGAARIGGSPSVIEEKQYSDMWADDQYLQFIYERLQLMRELLSPEGSLYVHIDYRRGHYIKVILDEVFGAHNFRNEIVVRRATKNLQSQFEEVAMLNVATDSIFWYSKSPSARYRAPLKAASARQRRGRWASFYNDEDRPTMRYELFGQTPARGQWKWSKERAYRAAANYQEYLEHYAHEMGLEEYWERTGRKLEFLRPNPRTGKPEYWVEPQKEVPCDSNWLDIPAYAHSTGYPTEKSEALLERIIRAGTEPGELVADLFCGSGTTLAVAQKLGRRWIGSDSNLGAIHTTVKRLAGIVGQHRGARLRPKWYSSFGVYKIGPYKVLPDGRDAVGPRKAEADIVLKREGSRARVEIRRFYSPRVWERLNREAGPVETSDWRQVVEAVFIDPDYDGVVLRPALLDVPAGSDTVKGIYWVEVVRTGQRIAIKIVDVLSEEFLAVLEV